MPASTQYATEGNLAARQRLWAISRYEPAFSLYSGVIGLASLRGGEAVEAEVRLRDEAARTAFLRDFVAAVGQLAKKYGAKNGEPFRVSFAAYPIVEAD